MLLRSLRNTHQSLKTVIINNFINYQQLVKLCCLSSCDCSS